MKHTKQINVPAKTEIEITKITCDFCGNELDLIFFDVDWVDIKYTTGWEDPDGETKQETRFDMCPECFYDKLVPWAKTYNVDPQIEETIIEKSGLRLDTLI